MGAEYKFKHDKNILALVSYKWSKNALIMNKDRLVICSVPVEDVSKSKSWIKNKNK